MRGQKATFRDRVALHADARGIPGIKPDRMIFRFIASFQFLRPCVTPPFALEIPTAAAKKMGMSAQRSDMAYGSSSGVGGRCSRCRPRGLPSE